MADEIKQPVNNTPEAIAPETVTLDRSQYNKLIAVNQDLAKANAAYKKDLATIISGFGEVAGMFAGKSLSMGTLTRILQNKDKLAKTMEPAFAVIQKYTTNQVSKMENNLPENL